jgi:hypothetical protein
MKINKYSGSYRTLNFTPAVERATNEVYALPISLSPEKYGRLSNIITRACEQAINPWATKVADLDIALQKLHQQLDEAEAGTKRLKELLGSYMELAKESEAASAGMLFVHGWKYPKELVERGEKLRNDIDEAMKK